MAWDRWGIAIWKRRWKIVKEPLKPRTGWRGEQKSDGARLGKPVMPNTCFISNITVCMTNFLFHDGTLTKTLFKMGEPSETTGIVATVQVYDSYVSHWILSSAFKLACSATCIIQETVMWLGPYSMPRMAAGALKERPSWKPELSKRRPKTCVVDDVESGCESFAGSFASNQVIAEVDNNMIHLMKLKN